MDIINIYNDRKFSVDIILGIIPAEFVLKEISTKNSWKIDLNGKDIDSCPYIEGFRNWIDNDAYDDINQVIRNWNENKEVEEIKTELVLQ